MGRRRLLWTGAASILAIACAVWLLLPAPVPVDVAAVTRGPFTQTTDEQARTRIRDHYTVVAPLAGELDRIALREGDDVEAGAVVARLRPTLPALLDVRTQQELQRRVEAARAAKEAAEARVARAQVAQAQARLEVERSRKLAESHLVAAAKLETDELTLAMTAQELESARADAHVAQHDIDIAVAALGRAHAGGSAGAGSEWSLVAPIAGRVLRVHQKSAVTVTAGAPLVEFGDPGNLEVLIELLTTEAPPVVPGAVVRLTNWGGSGPLSGRVRRIEPWGFTKVSALGVEEQRVNVLVDIVSPRRDWQSLGEGYRLDAQIEIYRRSDALQIPNGAMFRSGTDWFVYAVRPDGRVRRTPVTVGHRNDRNAELLGGLAEGDRVVVYPGDAIRDGVRVVPTTDSRR